MRRLPPFLPLAILLTGLCLAGPARAVAPGVPPHPVERVPFVKLGAGSPGAAARQAHELARQGAVARRQAELQATLGPQPASRRALAQLAARGLGPARLTDGAADVAKAGIDTLHVLIVRIGFATDRSGDLTSVTTDGNFQLTPDPSVRIDPPPHDRAFYTSHLYGLSQYYTFQSGGRLVIDGRVLPLAADDCYRLSDLADYGPGADGGWTIERLERLVRDMIAAADTGLAADGLDLSDFGDGHPFSYVIFVHAGSDWQSDVNGDSPNDVPTFFVNLGEPVALRGGGTLSECSVIPETTTQDGYLGSVAAALYHEFGHALGLVDIYDTTTGLPGVGIWTLMDSGTNLAANIGFPTPTADNPDSIEVVTVSGVLPPSLGAWDKWFLGWLETATLDGAQAAQRLPAVQIRRTAREYQRYQDAGYDIRLSDPQALVAGLSRREFYLLENRWVPLSGAELPEQGGVGLLRDQQTGVILYLAGDDPDGTGPLPPRNTGMYDFFMPDGGLLVWHVNQQRIEASLADNTINAHGDGLRIVEADGIQDIGVIDPYVLGFWGSASDPFHADKPGSPRTGVTLSPEVAPASRAFDRAWTGVQATDISANEVLMTFTAGVDPLVASPPPELPPYDAAEAAALGGAPGPRALEPSSVTPCRMATYESLVCADAPQPAWGDTTFTAWGATLFALRQDGSPLALPPTGLPAGAVHRFAAPLAGPPIALSGLPGVEGDLVIAAARDGEVAALRPASGADNVVVDWTRRVGASLPFGPAAGGDSLLLCCVAPDTLRLLRPDGTVGAALRLPGGVGAFVAPPLPLALPAAAGAFIVFTDLGWQVVGPPVAGGLPSPAAPPVPYEFAPAGRGPRAAVLPRADGATLVVCGPRGELRAWRLGAAGDEVARLPWPEALDEAPAGDPAVADLDGDGRNDFVIATPHRAFALSADGVALRGYPVPLRELFPLADSTRFAGPVTVLDVTGDGRDEACLLTDGGHLILLDAEGRLLTRTPFQWGGSGASGLAAGRSATAAGRVLWLAEAGGRTAPPLDRRWLGGRLVGYRVADSALAALRTSEWLGPGGGPARGGPVGEPHDLGALSPVQPETDRVVVYPNPARNSRVTVRFYSADTTPARLALHDLDGEIVAEATAPANAGVVNEFVWDLPRLAGGVYLLRVEAGGATGRRRWLTRLAVER
ncbi:MAG: immune inhibitor A domain-containing protein [Candidatus Krumholzibacteriia bacterium]